MYFSFWHSKTKLAKYTCWENIRHISQKLFLWYNLWTKLSKCVILQSATFLIFISRSSLVGRITLLQLFLSSMCKEYINLTQKDLHRKDLLLSLLLAFLWRFSSANKHNNNKIGNHFHNTYCMVWHSPLFQASQYKENADFLFIVFSVGLLWGLKCLFLMD